MRAQKRIVSIVYCMCKGKNFQTKETAQPFKMSLIIPTNFQHILRVMNTNIDGKRNVMFAMCAIKGIGRRYANLVLKKVRPK